MARPTKKTPTVEERIVAAIKLGATYQRAAVAGGITYRTLAYWMADAEERGDQSEFFHLSHAIKDAESYAANVALQSIQRAARGGQWQAGAWLLERRYPHEYGKTVQEHSGEQKLHVIYENNWRAPGSEIETATADESEAQG